MEGTGPRSQSSQKQGQDQNPQLLSLLVWGPFLNIPTPVLSSLSSSFLPSGRLPGDSSASSAIAPKLAEVSEHPISPWTL